jgi:hypothetical protein
MRRRRGMDSGCSRSWRAEGVRLRRLMDRNRARGERRWRTRPECGVTGVL